MGFIEAAVLGAGLSMDSFALSVTNGISCKRARVLSAILCSLCFGLFQGSLTTAGYAAGSAFADRIKAFDHWIALFALCFIGIGMMLDSRSGDEDSEASLSPAGVIAGGFATSLDALAVGVGLSALDTDIVFAAAVITLVSVVLCLAGFFIGNSAGRHLGARAKLAGGAVLILLGVKIFVQHVFF